MKNIRIFCGLMEISQTFIQPFGKMHLIKRSVKNTDVKWLDVWQLGFKLNISDLIRKVLF